MNHSPYRMKKDWIYYESTVKKHTMKFVLLGVLTVYLLFFVSNFVIPHPVSSAYTVMGETYSYAADRSVTVYEAIYDKDAQLFEVTMELSNNSYDNVNDYYFFLVPEGRYTYTNVTVETVMHDSMVTVLRVPNLRRFDEASLVFAPKLSEDLNEIPDDAVGTLVFNRNNISYDTIDQERSRSEYITFRLQANVEVKQEEVKAAETKLSELENKRAALEKEIQDLQENMDLYTSSEQESILNKIEGNGEVILEVDEEIEKQKKEVQYLKAEYEEILELLQQQKK